MATVGPNIHDKPFALTTPREALLFALNNVDRFDKCVIIMARNDDNDGGCMVNHVGAGVNTMEALGMLEMSKSRILAP